MNPLYYLFEENDGTGEEGLAVVYPLPYAEIDTLSEKQKEEAIQRKMLLTWSHSLEEIIGGQIRLGFRPGRSLREHSAGRASAQN